jgi:hypothetical protein
MRARFQFWTYLTVTLGRGRTTGGIIPEEKLAEVRGRIENSRLNRSVMAVFL